MDMDALLEQVRSAPIFPELTSFDRCDRCGAQAYVACVRYQNEVLLFCRHHHYQHAAKLSSEGWKSDNQSNRIDTHKTK